MALGSETAEAAAPSAAAWHLSEYACPESTVPSLGSTPEGRVTAQLHVTKPLYITGYMAFDKKGLDLLLNART